MAKRTPLRKNLAFIVGSTMAAVAFTLGVVLIASEAIFRNRNPYSALVTYLIIPGAIGGGLVLALIGLLVELRRRRKHPEAERALPVVDLNKPGTRRAALLTAVGISLFFGVSAVGTYRGFVYTESTQFCGTVCHQIMNPEYTAHELGPHARVSCVGCHIGQGAEWYVRSKLSGLRQVYRTLTDSYRLPIQVPISNLRPARETCEQCHWPEMFSGSVERVRWHFWYDEANTPSRYNMLMHVGGTDPATGEAHGIHWHTSRNEVVRYWASDRQRQVIPWVEVTRPDGTTTVFRGQDAPQERPPESEIRVMDCIDCHNRPAHQYPNPDALVNRALESGQLDRSWPNLKALSVDTLNGDYDTSAAAHQAIEAALTSHYSGPQYSAEAIRNARDVLSTIYDRSHYPEQHLDWRTYPDNIGHRNFPGCFRCHDNQHHSEGGEAISMDCSLCHDFVFQAHGEAAFGPTVYQTAPFQHPEGEPEMHVGFMCTDCHSPEAESQGNP